MMIILFVVFMVVLFFAAQKADEYTLREKRRIAAARMHEQIMKDCAAGVCEVLWKPGK